MADRAARPRGPGGEVLAAGAVLWRPARHVKDGVQVAVVHRPKYDDWSLPKGKLDPGEHVLVAAVREVREETGHRAVLGRPLGAQRYEAFGQPKTAYFWSARADGGAFEPGPEVDELVWLPVPAASGLVSQARDVETLAAFAGGPHDTVPVVLLRHGRAVARDRWDGEDTQRPLDTAGRQQAARLARVLPAYGPLRVHSSGSRRCTDSVRLLAEREGAPVEMEPALSEDGFHRDHASAIARLLELLDTGRPTVLCTHRPVLPALLGTACARGGLAVPKETLAPGGFWVLQVREGTPVSLERHQV